MSLLWFNNWEQRAKSSSTAISLQSTSQCPDNHHVQVCPLSVTPWFQTIAFQGHLKKCWKSRMSVIYYFRSPKYWTIITHPPTHWLMNKIKLYALMDSMNLWYRLWSFCVQLLHVFKFYSTAFRAGKVLKETAVSKMIPRAKSLGGKKRERERKSGLWISPQKRLKWAFERSSNFL